MLSASLPAAAAGESRLEISVADRDGAPLPEVVVYATRVDTALPVDPGQLTASIVQQEQSFSPHITVIRSGTAISFPNRDPVLHHVYSFSETKAFEMTVDAGSTPDTIRFATPGIVTLGCNIHDDMLAYVVIVDTPYFAITNGDGRASITGLPAGIYEIIAWTPRLADKNLPAAVIVEFGQTDTVPLEFHIESRLYPAHAQSATSLHWSY